MKTGRSFLMGLVALLAVFLAFTAGASAEPGQAFWSKYVGNFWVYDGSDLGGGSWTWTDEVSERDTTTIPGHATYLQDGYEDGYWEWSEWYEVSAAQLKLWQQEFWWWNEEVGAWDILTVTADSGLVVGNSPMSVGDSWSATTTGTVSAYSGGWSYPANISMSIDLQAREMVTTPVGTYNTYRVRFSLHVWNYAYGIDETITEYDWFVPYLGIVKWEDEWGYETEVLSSYHLEHKGILEFDQDFVPDILWRNSTTGANALWYMTNDGKAIKAAVGVPSCGTSWQVGGVADFDADGVPDIFWRNTLGHNAIWYMQSNGTAIKSVVGVPSCGTSWGVGGVADFDADGVPDIFWRNNFGHNALWYMEANGTSIKAAAGVPSCGTSWQVAGVADFDRDEVPDILWRNSLGHNAIWYMEAGGNAFKAAGGVPSCGTSWQVGKVADFDADGVPDIFWRNTLGHNAIWYMEADGSAIKGVAGVPSCGTSWEIGG